MSISSDWIKQAGKIADEEITSTIHGDYMSVESSSATMDKLELLIAQAASEEPDNADYHYWLACTKIAGGKGNTGLNDISDLAERFPDHVEIQGVLTDPQRWFAPFFYPSWHEKQQDLPEELQPLPFGGTLLISVRHGLQRVISLFRHVDRDSIQSDNLDDAPIDIRFNFMRTPDGPVVGVYVLITLPKGSLYVSETIINVDACPPNFRDLSNAGHWLLKLLSQQDYTFIILNDPKTGIFFNKKFTFNPGHKKQLKELRDIIDTIELKIDWNADSFIRAQQYYMNNFDIENLF